MITIAAVVLKWSLVLLFSVGAILNVKDINKEQKKRTPQVIAGVVAIQAALAIAIAALL